MKYRLLLAALITVLGAHAVAGEWPMWGHSVNRNMVSDEKGLPDTFDPGTYKGDTEEIDMATTKNVRWVAKLGSQSYGNPTVAGGRVYIGTNNEAPRDPKIKGDRGILMAFDEKTGKFLWQLAVPKLGTGKISDWEFLGICSPPTIEGNRVYIVTNRGEVMALDTEGMANGNDGPYKEEGQYLAGPGKPAVTTGAGDADIIWRFDMREELGVFPHNITSCSVLIVGDKVVATTSNGVDWNHTNIPNPRAPALCMLDKATGELKGEEASGISSRTLHSNWSSPSSGTLGEKPVIFFGGGDGFVYSFDTETKKADDGTEIFNEIWRYDGNPPQYRMKDGKPLKYATYAGPSEVIATPVFYKNRIYSAIGQDPEHGEGLGRISCINATLKGDISKTGAIWSYDKIHRSLSTVSIANGLVFIADFSGFIHCLDTETGKPYWVYDTKSHIWASTLVADGKVYVGTEDGDLVVLAADKTLKEIRKVDMRSPVYASVVTANSTLFIATPTHLYAVAKQ